MVIMMMTIIIIGAIMISVMTDIGCDNDFSAKMKNNDNEV